MVLACLYGLVNSKLLLTLVSLLRSCSGLSTELTLSLMPSLSSSSEFSVIKSFHYVKLVAVFLLSAINLFTFLSYWLRCDGASCFYADARRLCLDHLDCLESLGFDCVFSVLSFLSL